ncbi:MAG: hypothetical protein ABI584_05710 [Acidobacteriota bacterium]
MKNDPNEPAVTPSHPVATAFGGLGAGAAGAVAGAAMGGPIGAVIGGAVAAAAGAVAGNSFASEFDATEEAAFWKERFQLRGYYRPGTTFEQWEPAYRFGWSSARRPEHAHRSFGDLEDELSAEWRKEREAVGDDWRLYRDAVKDAWDRVRNA